MVESVNEIVARMRQALALSDPDVDTTIGSPVRKILDAVGEVIAEAGVDAYLLDYQYDIDAKQGSDLDDFVRLFGFTRFPAKRAVGSVTFERSTAATEEILIPLGTQLSTEGAAPIVVQTTTPALMVIGDTAITVPVQAVVGGAQGNVPANSIRRRLTEFEGVTSFTNTVALSGGADPETDEQLRDRFKRTVFRGMAGTEHMFLGIALDDESVTQANVLGASKKYRETIQTVSGTATSSNPSTNIRYTYANSSVMGPDIEIGDILTPGVHYEFDHTQNPPVITLLGPMADGVFELEYEYVPWASRNDPENGVTNRVDVWVNGSRPTEAAEIAIVDTARVFDTTPGSPFNRANFLREDAETMPTAGNFFVPFSFAPVIDASVDDVIEIDGQEYVEGTDYWLVNDVTQFGGTPISLSGIEIRSVANGGAFEPSDGDIFDAHYLFNEVPRDIEVAARAWRLVTTDLRVHQAVPVYLNFFLAVIYNAGYPPDSVNPLIESELGQFIANIGFNGVLQISDILEVVHRVDGVDAVRLLTDDDGYEDEDTNPHWAIERVSPLGNFLHRYSNGGTPDRAVDVIFGDHEYPLFNSVVVVPKAQNTFGPV